MMTQNTAPLMTSQQPTVFDITSVGEQQIELQQPGEYLIRLMSCGAEVVIRHSISLSQTQHHTLKVTIQHLASRTKAKTVLLGTAEDRSFIRLAGKIVIEPDCIDCESFLTERVLLLSPDAKAEVVPDLEIHNNAVKCSHAASVSYVPEDQIFYLMSRGLNRNEAIKEIVAGFLGQ